MNRKSVMISVFAGLLAAGSPVQPATAAFVTDGALLLNIENFGQFNSVTLNALPVDASAFVQIFTGSCTFTPVSPVTVNGASATYTATCGSLDVTVDSTILGPLGSMPATSSVLRQVLTFFNNTAGPLALQNVSDIDADLDAAGDDTVAYDPATSAVFSTDPGNRLLASRGRSSCSPGTFGFDADFLGGESVTFPMDNGVGPVGPADTAISLGFDCLIGAGQSATVEYLTLFSTAASTVSADLAFPCPETPSAACMSPVKRSIQIRDHADDAKDQIKWKWVKGGELEQADFPDPSTTNRYNLCIYDSSLGEDELVATVEVDPGSSWVTKDPKGWSYKDKTGASDGVTKVQLKTGAAGKSKAQLGAKGALIDMPVPFSLTELMDQDTSVTVQLHNGSTSLCLTSEFTAATKNTATDYKAKF